MNISPLAFLTSLVGLLLFTSSIHAQSDSLQLSGKVISAVDELPVSGATIQLENIKTKNSRYVAANADGEFVFEQLEQAFYKLKITSISFKPFQKVFRLQLADSKLGVISLAMDEVALKEVKIEEQYSPVQQKGDTTQYNADAFKTNVDANASDLVKKMPGIEVSKDGVKANGESVQQVLLDGKRFFGQDPLLSLNTIPAEIIDKVLVYDEQSEQAKLTGFDDGNTTKTMNLITKNGKSNGSFGRLYTGTSEEERYKIGGSANYFKDELRLTGIGMSNNINIQNFGQEDIVGLGGSGGRGGFRRGGGSNFITSEQDGITQTHSYGLNFINTWKEKTSIEGSYFFNQTFNEQYEKLKKETFLRGGSQFYDEESKEENDGKNHRLNLLIKHEFDKSNNLIFRTNTSIQSQENNILTIGSSSFSNGTTNTQTNNLYLSKNKAINTNNSLIFQHKFEKIGRTFSSEFKQVYTPSEQLIRFEEYTLDSLINYDTDAKAQNYSASFSYTEPVGKAALITVSYEVSTTQNKAEVDVETLNEVNQGSEFVSGLSNHFKSHYSYHQPSIEYGYNKYGTNLRLEVATQFAQLKNTSYLDTRLRTEKNFLTLLPSFHYRKELSSKTRFFTFFRSSTNAPTISQLQNVLNNTNPLFVNIGNPYLSQSLSHTLRMGIRHINSEKNLMLSNFSSLSTQQNYMGTKSTILRQDSLINSILVPAGAQISSPINLDGYWSLQNNTTFSRAIPKIKNNLNTSLNLGYSRIPGLSNETENYSKNYSAAIKVGLASNISEKIDYDFSYEIDYNSVRNSLQKSSTNKYYTQTLSFDLNLTLKTNYVFRNQTYFQRYQGINNAFNTSYTLWNIGFARKFLKGNKGELEFSVFDVLGQNQSFSQSVSAIALEEKQTEVLQQYFMLTFTYNFKQFK